MGLYRPDELQENQDATIAASGIPAPMQAIPEPEELTFQEGAKLQARTAERTNYLISMYHNGVGSVVKSDPTYNPWPRVKDTKYAEYPDYFTNVDNDEELDARMKQVDELEEYGSLASRAPTTAFWSGMAWGMFDPLLVVPGVGAAKIAMLGKQANVVRSAVQTGAITATALGVGEAALQASQPERTATESAITMATGGLVGAAFGGIVSKTIRPNYKADLIQTPTIAAQDEALVHMNKVMSVAEDEIPAPAAATIKPTIKGDEYESAIIDYEDKSMAGHVSPFTRRWAEKHPQEEMLTTAQEKTQFKDADVVGFTDEELAQATAPTGKGDTDLSAGAAYVTFDTRIMGMPQSLLKVFDVPHVSKVYAPVSLEMLADSSGIVRTLAGDLGYSHLPLKGASGEQIVAPFSYESRLHDDFLKAMDFRDNMTRLWTQQANQSDNIIGEGISTMRGMTKQSMTRGQFDEAVMDAISAGGKHKIPEVQEAAQYASKLFRTEWEKGKAAGIWGKDAQPFDNYFRVIYDIPGIIGNRIGAEEAILKVLAGRRKATVTYTTSKGEEATAPALYDIDTKQVDWAPRNGEQLKNVTVEGAPDLQELRGTASDVIDNVLRMGDKSLALGDIDRLNFTRGTDAGRPRKIVMTDRDYQIVKPFMVKNFSDVTNHYLASMSRAVNHKQLLDKYGVDDMKDLLGKIRDEYGMWIKSVQNNKLLSESKRNSMIASLNKKREKSIEKARDAVAISLGQYKKRTAFDPLLRSATQYNVATLFGSIPIAAIGDPAAALIKNSLPDVAWNGWMFQLQKFITRTGKWKDRDYRNALTAVQNGIDDLVRFTMNPDQGSYLVGAGEKVAQGAGKATMVASGMTTWNNFFQRVSHDIAENNILSYVTKPSKKGQSYLAEIGINDEMANRIKLLQEKYGESKRGTHISNTHLWGRTGSISTEQAQEAAAYFNNAIRTEVHKSPIITEMLDLGRFWQQSELTKNMALSKGFSMAAVTKLGMGMATRRDHKALMGLTALTGAGMLTALLQDKLAGRESVRELDDWILKGIEKSGVTGIIGDQFFQAKYALDAKEKWGDRAWTQDPIDYMLGPSARIVRSIAAHGAASAGYLSGKSKGYEIDRAQEYRDKTLIPFRTLWWMRLLNKK